jgi:ribonuclease H2 subunit B
VVYRFSPSKVMEYLRIKVARLATPKVFEGSRTLVRGLAKVGLMDDGKEELLQGIIHHILSVDRSTLIWRKAGRIRTACDLIAQYVPNSLWGMLMASYEFVYRCRDLAVTNVHHQSHAP